MAFGAIKEDVASALIRDLRSVAYSDTTTDVTYGYDRRGRQTAITNGAAICMLTYNDAGQLLIETNSGGTLNGLAVTNAYDSLLRRTAVALRNQTSTLTQYGYDTASRLANVTNAPNLVAYTVASLTEGDPGVLS